MYINIYDIQCCLQSSVSLLFSRHTCALMYFIHISCYSQYSCMVWYLTFHTKSIFSLILYFLLEYKNLTDRTFGLIWHIFMCSSAITHRTSAKSLNLLCLLTGQSFNCKWKWHLWRNSSVYLLKSPVCVPSRSTQFPTSRCCCCSQPSDWLNVRGPRTLEILMQKSFGLLARSTADIPKDVFFF